VTFNKQLDGEIAFTQISPGLKGGDGIQIGFGMGGGIAGKCSDLRRKTCIDLLDFLS